MFFGELDQKRDTAYFDLNNDGLVGNFVELSLRDLHPRGVSLLELVSEKNQVAPEKWENNRYVTAIAFDSKAASVENLSQYDFVYN